VVEAVEPRLGAGAHDALPFPVNKFINSP
jgi:hypothetical protein